MHVLKLYDSKLIQSPFHLYNIMYVNWCENVCIRVQK